MVEANIEGTRGEDGPAGGTGDPYGLLGLLKEHRQAILFAEGVATGAVLNEVNFVVDIAKVLGDSNIHEINFPNQREVDYSLAGVAGELTGLGVGTALTGIGISSMFKTGSRLAENL